MKTFSDPLFQSGFESAPVEHGRALCVRGKAHGVPERVTPYADLEVEIDTPQTDGVDPGIGLNVQLPDERSGPFQVAVYTPPLYYDLLTEQRQAFAKVTPGRAQRYTYDTFYAYTFHAAESNKPFARREMSSTLAQVVALPKPERVAQLWLGSSRSLTL